MGAFLSKPKRDKSNEHGDGNNLWYGVGSMQGWRAEMEDAHYAYTSLGGQWPDWSAFGVFDGHAGFRVAEYVSKHILEFILKTDEFNRRRYEQGIRTGFLWIDEVMRQLPELEYGSEKVGGTTALCVFITPSQIYVANCGDSRAVLCRNGVPIFATQDHKPQLPREHQRIRQAGGTVLISRVNGNLAVSRALGDYLFKMDVTRSQCQQLVSPEPDVFRRERHFADEFLVLACDGVWDVISNRDLCSFVRARLQISHDLELVCNEVLEMCLHMGSRDNMSIVLIVFPGAPRPNEAAVAGEIFLNREIENVTLQVMQLYPQMSLDGVVASVSRVHLAGLPPGGGLAAKYALIERLYEQMHRTCNAEHQDLNISNFTWSN